ncbi:MAG TPA: HNH endonuclease [Planctomycetes bacterium]|jgi:hypothetical protein|nr:HNH endonuclease [Planctomycetota bacterium]
MSDCIIGTVQNAQGYSRHYAGKEGRISRYFQGHRIEWERVNGPIPEGLVVRHKCDNPPCINPDHLEIGTLADNNEDRRIRGRSRSKTTLAQKAEIVTARAAGEKLKDIAGRYGITHQAVSWIVKNYR